jgi:hypothetical protein
VGWTSLEAPSPKKVTVQAGLFFIFNAYAAPTACGSCVLHIKGQGLAPVSYVAWGKAENN